jgi:hypothetical protein
LLADRFALDMSLRKSPDYNEFRIVIGMSAGTSIAFLASRSMALNQCGRDCFAMNADEQKWMGKKGNPS